MAEKAKVAPARDLRELVSGAIVVRASPLTKVESAEAVGSELSPT